jgi:hypothetical protein
MVIASVFGIWRPLSEPEQAELEITPDSPGTGLIAETTQALPTLAVLPTLTPRIVPDSCGDAPPSRLRASMQAHVATPGEGSGVRRNLILRDAPGGERIGLLEPGTPVLVVSDFACTGDGLRWWPIEAAGMMGWSVEGFAPDDYLLVPGWLQ